MVRPTPPASGAGDDASNYAIEFGRLNAAVASLNPATRGRQNPKVRAVVVDATSALHPAVLDAWIREPCGRIGDAFWGRRIMESAGVSATGPFPG